MEEGIPKTGALHPAQEAYAQGRSTLASALVQRLGGEGTAARRRVLRILPDLLWSDACADEQGVLRPVFPSPYCFRRYAIGPPRPEARPVVERCGDYCRLQTTTNWVLDLRGFEQVEAYFAALSKSMKKKLKRYVNGADRWGLRLERIRTCEQLERFLRVFAVQFSGSNWETTHRADLLKAYLLFEELGCGKGYLMLDEQGVDAVAVLGYYTDRAFNLHLLARQDSALDFLSPGYCAVYALIQEVLEEQRADYFFFGPGHFEYKERFLGIALPVYRYERRTPFNLPGLIRLWHRAQRNEKRR